MELKLLYAGFETCFGPSTLTQGAGPKTHPEPRFRAILILYNVWVRLAAAVGKGGEGVEVCHDNHGLHQLV